MLQTVYLEKFLTFSLLYIFLLSAVHVSCPNNYSITWHNVQKNTTTRHATSMKKSNFQLWALAFMAENRVPFTSSDKGECVSATSVPLNTFLPGMEDWECLRQRMEVIVQRILTRNVLCFAELEGNVVKHIPHEHSKESAKSSNLVSHIPYNLFMLAVCAVKCFGTNNEECKFFNDK